MREKPLAELFAGKPMPCPLCGEPATVVAESKSWGPNSGYHAEFTVVCGRKGCDDVITVRNELTAMRQQLEVDARRLACVADRMSEAAKKILGK